MILFMFGICIYEAATVTLLIYENNISKIDTTTFFFYKFYDTISLFLVQLLAIHCSFYENL